MKILLVSLWAISTKVVGGTERFTIDLADSLTDAGHCVDVLMLSGKSTEINGIEYHSMNLMGNSGEADEYTLEQYFGKINNSSTLEKIGRYLELNFRAEGYDAIQLNSLLFLAAWSSKRRIFTIHTNPYEFDLNWGESGFDFICTWVSQFAPASTVFTAPSRAYALQYEKLMNRTIEYIPHAIDSERLLYKAGDARGLRTKYDLGSYYVVLMPSRLDMEQKRPQIALEALIQAKENLPEFVAVFTGVDKQYAENILKLEAIAIAAKVKTKFIRFEQMAEAYEVADLVVLPSRSESFGYSALEALSIPRKSVLNAIPSYCEIAEGNQNAYLTQDTLGDFALTIARAVNAIIIPTPEKWTNRYSFERWAEEYVLLFSSNSHE